jgi:GTP-binding protein
MLCMPNESYRLLGEERSIVSDVAGTTRDAVDALLHRGNATYRFVDTAGVRKRGKVEYGPEFFMVNRFGVCPLSAI